MTADSKSVVRWSRGLNFPLFKSFRVRERQSPFRLMLLFQTMDLAKDSENLEYDANTERNSEGSCVNLCNTDDAESLQQMSYKEKRKEKRSKSKVKDATLKSLQPLSGSNNLILINDLLRTKSERRRQKLMGLRAILEDLLAPKDGSGLPSGIMSFDR